MLTLFDKQCKELNICIVWQKCVSDVLLYFIVAINCKEKHKPIDTSDAMQMVYLEAIKIVKK